MLGIKPRTSWTQGKHSTHRTSFFSLVLWDLGDLSLLLLSLQCYHPIASYKTPEPRAPLTWFCPRVEDDGTWGLYSLGGVKWYPHPHFVPHPSLAQQHGGKGQVCRYQPKLRGSFLRQSGLFSRLLCLWQNPEWQPDDEAGAMTPASGRTYQADYGLKAQ